MQLESAAGRLKGFEIFLNKRAGFEWLEWKTDETRSKSRQKIAEIGVFGRFWGVFAPPLVKNAAFSAIRGLFHVVSGVI